MSILAISFLEIPVGNYRLIVSDDTPADSLAVATWPDLPKGWRALRSPTGKIHFDGAATSRGFQSLQIFENHSYRWKLVPTNADVGSLPVIRSSLEEPGKARWRTNVLENGWSGEFSVTNYLGTADIRIGDHPPLRFEVRSSKLDYETEYTAMVEAIASECQRLVLEWNSPTSIPLEKDSSAAGSGLLEQFLFLRNVLGTSRLDFYLELLQRQPHTRLVNERYWAPLGAGSAINLSTDPLHYGRRWAPATNAAHSVYEDFAPYEIADERRFESIDTPPNRFVRFAFEQFSGICTRVMDHFSERTGTAYLEASAFKEKLDGFLSGSFLQEVGRLDRIPFESQALTKREGYRDILAAWLLVDAAGKIDWQGREDAYDGTNRNVALLYEYWLYFVLRRLLTEIDEITEIVKQEESTKGLAVFERFGETARLNLKQGKASISVFRKAGRLPLRIHFYYNRPFSPSSDPMKPGTTYSRHFRPDFTLAVFPESFAEGVSYQVAENRAEVAGELTYLHFDAKYRVDRLVDLFGIDAPKSDNPMVVSPDVQRELDEESVTSSATNTYKRGDLLKMHTYNDAIRRTAGSYVLYPGTDGGQQPFLAYHELLPSVGAFVMRPTKTNDQVDAIGSGALREFLTDVISYQEYRFSRRYRIVYYTHDTLRMSANRFNVQASAPGTLPPADLRALIVIVASDEEFDQALTSCKVRYAIGPDGLLPVGPEAVHYVVALAPGMERGFLAQLVLCTIEIGDDGEGAAKGDPSNIFLTCRHPSSMTAHQLKFVSSKLGGASSCVSSWTGSRGD